MFMIYHGVKNCSSAGTNVESLLDGVLGVSCFSPFFYVMFFLKPASGLAAVRGVGGSSPTPPWGVVGPACLMGGAA
jgi:hypothetical protein